LGTLGNDTLSTGAGNDKVYGSNGNDIISGESGNDTLSGDAGNDILNGGDGNDMLLDSIGDDTLRGDAGADYLAGGEGNDTLQGGIGNDTLSGDTGNNTYLFGRGDGQDMIHNQYDANAAKSNVLRFGPGVAPSDINLRQLHSDFWGSAADVEFSIVGTSDKIVVNGMWRENISGTKDYSSVQRVEFDNGTVWDLAAITARVLNPAAMSASFGGDLGDTENASQQLVAAMAAFGAGSEVGEMTNWRHHGWKSGDYLVAAF
jgi:trimeric autotransporter adhesin